MVTKKSNIKAPYFYNKSVPFKTTEVYDTYWKFATERQQIFFNRLNNEAFWTNDPILSTYKFTNVYRATDRVSQYLIRNVIYNEAYPNSAKEILFRIFLFKLFNKIETWELLTSKLGILTFESYNFKDYDKILTQAMEKSRRIYSAAYIMPSIQSKFGFQKNTPIT